MKNHIVSTTVLCVIFVLSSVVFAPLFASFMLLFDINIFYNIIEALPFGSNINYLIFSLVGSDQSILLYGLLGLSFLGFAISGIALLVRLFRNK